MSLMSELGEVLQGYLVGTSSLRDCDMWLAGVVWDDGALTEEEKETLGLFELLAVEVAEGFREESEFLDEATRFVAAGSNSVSSRQSVSEILVRAPAPKAF